MYRYWFWYWNRSGLNIPDRILPDSNLVEVFMRMSNAERSWRTFVKDKRAGSGGFTSNSIYLVVSGMSMYGEKLLANVQ